MEARLEDEFEAVGQQNTPMLLRRMLTNLTDQGLLDKLMEESISINPIAEDQEVPFNLPFLSSLSHMRLGDPTAKHKRGAPGN